jgi:electron transfer flavoprotein alpha subunit
VAVAAPGKAAERVEFVSLEQVKSARPELAEARVVVSGGRALPSPRSCRGWRQPLRRRPTRRGLAAWTR